MDGWMVKWSGGWLDGGVVGMFRWKGGWLDGGVDG